MKTAFLILALFFSPLNSYAAVNSYRSPVSGAPVVAIYKGRGTSSESVRSFKMFLQHYGYSYVSLTAQQIRNGALNAAVHQVLYMPGGAAMSYVIALGELGASRVKDYVASGGGYIGICAGAYYATQYAEGMRDGRRSVYPLGIGLMEGVAIDGTQTRDAGFKHALTQFELSEASAALPREFRGLLIGGPAFRYSDAWAAEHKLHVIAHFKRARLPGIISYQYGNGRVFLAAPHIEIYSNDSYSGFGRFVYGTDPERDWPLLQMEGMQFVLRSH